MQSLGEFVSLLLLFFVYYHVIDDHDVLRVYSNDLFFQNITVSAFKEMKTNKHAMSYTTQ